VPAPDATAADRDRRVATGVLLALADEVR